MNKPITHDSIQKECEGILDLLKNRRVDTLNWHVALNEKLLSFYLLLAPLYQQASVVIAKALNLSHIDRSHPFDPVSLLGQGASFWRGPKDGKGTNGELEQDSRSLAISDLDLDSIQFKSYIPEGQSYISGENRLVAIKATENDIALDPTIGEHLYEEEGQKSLRYLYDRTGVTWMEFLGQTLRVSGGGRCSLVLCRSGVGSWGRSYDYLGRGRIASCPAAVVSKK